MIPDDITIDISIPKPTAIKFLLTGTDQFYEALPAVSKLVEAEVKRLHEEYKDMDEEAALIKSLQDKGVMSKTSETAPNCLDCINGRTLQNEEKCERCGRYVDNYGELFPMR